MEANDMTRREAAASGRRKRAVAALAALVVVLTAAIGIGSVGAQTSAGRPIRVIVPFAAGSYTDSVVRIVAPALGERLGATIVVDNRPGANGVIGADIVAKSVPNGLTFLMGGTSVNAVNPGLYKSLPYDPVKDLVPVARFGVLPFLLLVNLNVPVRSVTELIEYAKKNPGKLAYATPNSVTLVGMETFKRDTGADILSVPYKSSPQAMLDLISGQVQLLIADFATAMPHVRAGNARVLAATMARRSSLLPDVPTVGEVLKGYDVSAWNGLFAPAGTPRETLARISDALNAVLATRDIQEKLTSLGFDIAPLGPDAFGPYVRGQISTWGRLIRETGIKPE